MAESPLQTDRKILANLLERASSGDQEAVSHLFPLVYQELRKLASGMLMREWRGRSLHATELVHEAYMRLLPGENLAWNDRSHFVAITGRAMRQILVERARARYAQKRGGHERPVTLIDVAIERAETTVDLLNLDQALTRLGALDPELVQVVEMRYFAGLTIEETAEALQAAPATIKRRWTFAKTWLRRELEP